MINIHFFSAFSCDIVNILKVPTQVATLSKSFMTELAGKGPLPSMFSKMISEITALLKRTATSRVLTFEVKFNSLSIRIFHTNGLVPLLRNSFKSFVFISS